MDFFTPLYLFYGILFVGGVNSFSAKITFHEIEEVMFSRVFLSCGPKFSVCILELQAVYVYLMQRACIHGTPPSTFGRLAYALAMTCCTLDSVTS